MQRTQGQFAGAGSELACNCRDHRASGLARPECVERAGGDDGQAEGQIKAFRHLVRGDLAGGIRRLPYQRMAFRNRNLLGRAVNLGGRDVHEACKRVAVATGLQHIDCAHYVGVDIRPRCLVAVGYGDQAGQVEDIVATLDEFADEFGIPDIAVDQFHLVNEALLGIAQPAQFIPAVVINQCSDSSS